MAGGVMAGSLSDRESELVRLYFHDDKKDEARELLRDIIAGQPDSVAAHAVLCTDAVDAGQNELARELAMSALSDHPDSALAVNRALWVLSSLDDYRAAARVALEHERVARSVPENALQAALIVLGTGHPIRGLRFASSAFAQAQSARDRAILVATVALAFLPLLALLMLIASQELTVAGPWRDVALFAALAMLAFMGLTAITARQQRVAGAVTLLLCLWALNWHFRLVGY